MKQLIVISSLLLLSTLHAQNVTLKGTQSESSTLAPISAFAAKRSSIPTRKLLRLHLSSTATNTLKSRVNGHNSNKKAMASYLTSGLPAKVQLGMNSINILDQGYHGSCVTFAVTAAIDAALGEEIASQLCQLQLGNYLEKFGYRYSGWDGSFGSSVLSQIEHFGLMSHQDQTTVGCGGLTEYPAYDETAPEGYISPKQFHQYSVPVFDQGIEWSTILDPVTAFEDSINPGKTLLEVKKSLNNKDRLIFGVLLPGLQFGENGAVGTLNKQYDTWVFTPEIAREVVKYDEFAGHEMIITGYNDTAVAIDDKGRHHRGLLTLRNSWGIEAGDKGNYYMSYDYFKILTDEVYRLRTEHEEN